jgi:hypothetical protein
MSQPHSTGGAPTRGQDPKGQRSSALWVMLELCVDVVCAFGFGVLGYRLTESHKLQAYLTILLGVVGFFTPILFKAYWWNARNGFLVPAKAFKDFHTTHDEVLTRLRESLGLFVAPGFSKFVKAIDQWRSRSLDSPGAGQTRALELRAWDLFTDAYFGEESERIERDGYILTNTRCFTDLYWKATELLTGPKPPSSVPKQKKPRKLIRFHITGMLPEEFYNGPQIAYRSDNLPPLLFCHKWEKYKGLYDYPLSEWSERLTVQRYIVVRDPRMHMEAELGALSNLESLKKQASLWIGPHDLNVATGVERDCPGVLQRLFLEEIPNPVGQTTTQADLSVRTNKILNREDYHYWPIVELPTCPKRTGDCRWANDWTPLLKAFAERWHTDAAEALYCVLTDSEWSQISSNQHLKECFRAAWTPEIVLFGEEGGNQWYFGFMGHYRRFTPDIELRFLSATQATELYMAFTGHVRQNNAALTGRLIDLLASMSNGQVTSSCPAGSFAQTL